MARKNMRNGQAKCKTCGAVKMKIRKSYGRFVDEAGKLWNGKACNDCKSAFATKCRRTAGVRAVDDLPYRSAVRGRASERLAAKHFEGQGYEVKLTSYLGPDLRLRKQGAAEITVEVKSVTKVGEYFSWAIAPVLPTRQQDDLIAMVFPDGTVIVEQMQQHLRQCNSSGGRTVTKIMKSLGHCPPKRKPYERRANGNL